MKEMKEQQSVFKKIFREIGRGFLWSLGGAFVIVPSVAMLTEGITYAIDRYIYESFSAIRNIPVEVVDVAIRENDVTIILELKNSTGFEYSLLDFELEFYSEDNIFLYQRFVQTKDVVGPGENEYISLTFQKADLPSIEQKLSVKAELIGANRWVY